MSQTQSNSNRDDLGDIFVAVTGDEEVTEKQETDSNRRDVRGESRIDEAVRDGLEDAIDGAEADAGDPGG
jgi:hypothetical protein